MEAWELKQKQSLPLSQKIHMTERRIKEFYEGVDGNVYISFSGGKDSTVLLDMVRKIYPNVIAVFSDTGMEFPEVREFVKTIDNVKWIRPKLSFKATIDKWGFPVVSKDVSSKIKTIRNPTEFNKASINLYMTGFTKKGYYARRMMLPKKWRYLLDAPFKISDMCCHELKEKPLMNFQSKEKLYPFMGILAEESFLRRNTYLKYGCNVYKDENKQYTKPRSSPLSFWTTNDIWEYINKFKIGYSNIYNMGYESTGCVFCMFGMNGECEPNRFQKMRITHPKLHDYCINVLGLKAPLDYMGVKY